MAQYFLLLDAAEFHDQFRPALVASWRKRSFAPLGTLTDMLLPRMRDFAVRYHLGSQEPLLAQVAGGLPFDRTFWHHLVGEVLWYGAVDIPELQTAEPAWTCLVKPPGTIVQAHRGSRDLVFGGGFYRPDAAGWNDVEDVRRLAASLAGVDVNTWQPEELAALNDIAVDERAEELADAQAWFPDFASFYRQAAEAGRIVVCESL
jgi:hypothetical protein